MQETLIRSLGWKDPLEKGMATHSSVTETWMQLTLSLFFPLFFLCDYSLPVGFPGGASGKESAHQSRRHKRTSGFDSWVRKIPWSRAWQPPPVFLPGKFHGQRSLVGYSPWGRKESDTAEQLHFASLHFCLLVAA